MFTTNMKLHFMAYEIERDGEKNNNHILYISNDSFKFLRHYHGQIGAKNENSNIRTARRACHACCCPSYDLKQKSEINSTISLTDDGDSKIAMCLWTLDNLRHTHPILKCSTITKMDQIFRVFENNTQ